MLEISKQFGDYSPPPHVSQLRFGMTLQSAITLHRLKTIDLRLSTDDLRLMT